MLRPFVSQSLLTWVTKPNRNDLLTSREHIERGDVTPVIDGTYPLSEAAEAMGYLERGHARGKVIVTV
jgi:NADPH:quinone reductase-like Zn-dependent oxidoreductase